jgi:hypothetical protein
MVHLPAYADLKDRLLFLLTETYRVMDTSE